MPKHYTWDELIKALGAMDNCCVIAEHIVIADLHTWIKLYSEWMDWFKTQGIDPKDKVNAVAREAQTRKRNLMWVFTAAQDSANLRKVGDLPKKVTDLKPKKSR